MQALDDLASAASMLAVAPSKRDVLRDYIERYAGLPAAWSAEYRADRATSFGGSELPALFGHNPYKSIKRLLEEKMGMCAPFTGNDFTVWGHLMEPVHTGILERLLGTHIHYNIGRIPYTHPTDADVCFKYTPDGIAAVTECRLDVVCGGNTHAACTRTTCAVTGTAPADTLLLIEQKAVAKRALSGEIPHYYIDQPMSGMCAVDITEVGLFTEAVFKRCSINVWNMESSVFTRSFFESAGEWPCPQQIGAVYFYADWVTRCEYVQDVSDGILDLGACDRALFFRAAADKRLQQVPGFGYEQPDAPADAPVCVGVMPWKLFDMSFHRVQKNKDFVKTYWPVIKAGAECIRTRDPTQVAATVARIKRLLCSIDTQRDAAPDYPTD